MIRRIAYCLAALCVVAAPVTAKAEDAFAGEFLTLGVGGRALAMGGAYGTLASDATAVYWNPAGLGQLDRAEATFMHSTLHGLDAYDYFNLSRPIGDSTWGVSWLRVGVDDIQFTTVPDRSAPVSSVNRPSVQSTESLSQNAFALAWGRRVLHEGAWTGYLGFAGKFIWIGAPRGTNAFGFGADIAALGTYRLSEGAELRASANLQDATRTAIYWNTVPRQGEPSHRDTILQNVKFGVALVHDAPPGEDSTLTLVAESDSKYDFEMRYGAEWDFANTLALRVGLLERKSNADTLRDITAGAGFRLGFTGGQSFTVDYAFTDGDLGASHRVSLGLGL